MSTLEGERFSGQWLLSALCLLSAQRFAPGRGTIAPDQFSLRASRVEQGYGLPFPFRRPECDQPGRPVSERIVDGALRTTVQPPVRA